MKQPPKTVTLKTVKLKQNKIADSAVSEPQEVDIKLKSVSAGKTAAGEKAVKKPRRESSLPDYELKNNAACLFADSEEAVISRESEEQTIIESELKDEEQALPVPKARRKRKPDKKSVSEDNAFLEPQLETEAEYVIPVSKSQPKRKSDKKPVREESTFIEPQLETEPVMEADVIADHAPHDDIDENNSLEAQSSVLYDIAAVPEKRRKPTRMRGRMPVWLMVTIDVLVAASVLVVFSYFHHGRSQAEETETIVIARPTATPAPTVPAVLDETGDDEQPPDEGEPTWAQKFAEHFTDTVVVTDTSYSSPNISINITQKTRGEGGELVTYYVADIYVADIESFQTYFAKDTYGSGFREHVLDMDIASGALFAMSGDYYGNSRSSKHGVVIRNGVLYRADDTRSDVCVLYYDGTMETYKRGEFDAEMAVARGAWQGWTFGPSLLDENGKAKTGFNVGAVLESENPRGGIGYYEPGHYVLVLVDGRDRGYSAGVTLEDFALIFEELGCSVAYNLDGGASAVMSYNDQVVNQPVGGGRTISDCLIIVEVE